MNQIKGTVVLSGTKAITGENELKSFLQNKGFGEKKEEQKLVELSLIEALYLLQDGKIKVKKADNNDESLSFQDLLEKGEKSMEGFYSKYLVYNDLRERGLLVRTGFKFGADFRVYERGATIGSSHSRFLVHVIPEEYTCSFPELSRAVRLAQHVNKKMVYAIVDEEGDITYYRVERIKF